MIRARKFLKLCIGSLLLIARPTPSPPLNHYPPSEMASSTELRSTESPTLPPRNDAPIAEVRKRRWQDHAAVLIPDPGYFVAGGLAGVASRKSNQFHFHPLTFRVYFHLEKVGGNR